MISQIKEKKFILLFSVIWVFTRLIAVGNPQYSFDHGNHLLIANEIVNGSLHPYKDFVVSHMPGLYLILSVGNYFSTKEIITLIPYILLSLFLLIVTYFISRKVMGEQNAKVITVLLTCNYYLLIFTTKSTADTIITPPALLLFFYWVAFRENHKNTYFIISLLACLSFFKLSILYIGLSMFISINIFFVSTEKHKRQQLYIALREIGILFTTLFVILTIINIINPNILQDVLTAHQVRERLPVSNKLSFFALTLQTNIFITMYLLILPIRIISYKDLKSSTFIKVLDLFIITYILTSVFLHKTYYIHHLLIVTIPCLLVLLATINSIIGVRKKIFISAILIIVLFDFGKTINYMTNKTTHIYKGGSAIYYNNYYNWSKNQKLSLEEYSFVPDIALKQQDKIICYDNDCNKKLWINTFNKNSVFIGVLPFQPHTKRLHEIAKDYYKNYCESYEGSIIYFQNSERRRIKDFCID